MTTLAVDLEPTGPDRTARLVLRGELDMDTADSVEQAVTQLLSGSPEVLVVDFAGVAFCDSSGIGALIRAHRSAADQGCRLEL